MSYKGAICLYAFAALLVAACGSSSPAYEQNRSAQQIVSDASQSTSSAGSFHVTLDETTTEGQTHADVDVEGSNIQGQFTGGGKSVRITHVGAQTFVYGADLADFLASTNPQAAAIIRAKASDKWVLMPSDFWDSGATKAFTLQDFMSCFKTEAGLSKKGTSTVSGKRSVEVDDQTSSKFYVSTDAPHYLVRVALQSGDTCLTDSGVSNQTFELSKFKTKFDVKAPSGYVDLMSLGSS